MLTSGPLPPNPPEVLNSQQTRRIVEQLADAFDLVIIDSPPAAGLSDATIIWGDGAGRAHGGRGR